MHRGSAIIQNEERLRRNKNLLQTTEYLVNAVCQRKQVKLIGSLFGALLLLAWVLVEAQATSVRKKSMPPLAPTMVTEDPEPPLIAVGLTPTLGTVDTTIALSATARGEGHPDGPATRFVTATLPTGEKVGLVNTVTGTVGLWEGIFIVTSSLSNGLHTVYYLGVDELGLEGEGRATLWVDKVPPDPPTLIAPRGSAYVRQSALTVIGTAEAHAPVQVTVGAAVTDTTSDANGDWSVAATLNEGENWIWAMTWDQAGNQSEPSTEALRVLDTVSPTVGLTVRPILRPGDGLTVIARITDVNPIEQHGVLLTLPDISGTGEMELIEQAGIWEATYYLPQETIEGTHIARVRALDVAGNVGQADEEFVVDNTSFKLYLPLVVRH